MVLHALHHFAEGQAVNARVQHVAWCAYTAVATTQLVHASHYALDTAYTN